MEYLEIAGVVTGLLYLYLEFKADAWLWIVGVIMPVIYIFVYIDAGLYADAAISVYYLIASVYGLWCWLRKSDVRNERDAGTAVIRISKASGSVILICAAAVIILTLVLGMILRFTDSTVPWADGFTTALSIVAMWMLAKKYVEQWLAWILADVGCAALYCYKDLYFTSALYALYAVIAVAGYRKWLKMI